MNTDPLNNLPPVSPAVRWFNSRRVSDMTAEEIRAFEVWLNRDPQNRAAFKKVEQAWDFLGELEDQPAIIDMRDRDERALDARVRARTAGAIAAGLIALIAGGWAVDRSGVLNELAWFAPPPVQEFRTSVGQRTTVTLLDRSVVTLDTDTILHVQMSGRERRVDLERGQAFFQVAKDRSRPFIVAAAGKTVRATGTAFDVRAEPGRFEVTLIEGRVRVQEQGIKHKDAPVADMRPGWRLAIGEDARWRMEVVDIEKATGWHHGTLRFFNAPLENAVAEMNRYSERKIVFRGPASERLVLGNFRAGDVDMFVEALEINKLARVASREEDRIELIAVP